MAYDVSEVQWYHYRSECAIPTTQETIRLLRILPGEGGEPLQISLERHSLQEKDLSYVALSYTWGSALNPRTILCDGAGMEVTTSLYAALVRLRDALTNQRRPLGRIVRYDTFGSDVCPIWIDSICINQSDVQERTDQVRIMDRIYRQARRVIVWLGEEIEQGEAEFCFIATELLAEQDLYGSGKREVLLESTDDNLVARFKQLLPNPWFSRTWVFQEVALAREAVVLWGSLSLNWTLIEFAVKALMLHYEFPSGFVHDPTFDGAFFNVMGLSGMHIAREHTSAAPLKTLANCLHLSRVNNATDPRDKVFAFLAVATQTGTLKADYAKSQTEVYTDCAWTLIGEMKSLELLTFTQAGYRGQDVPSWVPDWRVPTILHPMAWGEDRENKTYRAAGGYEFKIHHRSDRSQLVLEGVCCSSIAKIIAHQLPEMKEQDMAKYLERHADTPGDDVFHSFGMMAELLGLTGRHEHTNEPMTMAFIRTIVADLLPEGGERPSNKRYFPAYMQRYKMCEPTLEANEVKLYLRAIEEIRSKATRLLEGRCLAMTTDGCLSLVPNVAVESDEVFIVKGSAAPLLLRPRDEGLEYVGETYVHGMMQGEIVEWADDQGWQEVVIV